MLLLPPLHSALVTKIPHKCAKHVSRSGKCQTVGELLALVVAVPRKNSLMLFRSLHFRLPSLLTWCVRMSKLAHFASWCKMSCACSALYWHTVIIWHCNLSALKYFALYYSLLAMHTLIETYVTLALFQQTHYNKWIWQITVVSDIMPVASGAEAEK